MTSQVVQVRLSAGRRPYTYVWDGDTPLAVGERVTVPGPPSRFPGLDRGRIVGTVVKFGSDYPGPLESIIERVQ